MDEFEKWLRTVCFQKPTPEAYDLARDAWRHAIAQEREACAKLCEFFSLETGAACADAIRERWDKK
jgi:hypothetical protein